MGRKRNRKETLRNSLPPIQPKKHSPQEISSTGIAVEQESPSGTGHHSTGIKGEIKPQHVGRIRGELRDILQEKLKKIDKLTEIVMRQEIESNQGMDRYLVGSK